MASKLVFIGGGGALKAPPATRDALQRLPLVGLKIIHQLRLKKGFLNTL